MRKLFVGNLPASATQASVSALFSQYGRVRSLELVRDLFTGECRGFGFVEMEGHEAKAAMAALDGREFEGQRIKVREEKATGKHRTRRRR